MRRCTTGVLGPRGRPIDVVPSSKPHDRASAAPPDACPGIEREGTRRGVPHAVFGSVRGPGPGRSGGHATRRGRLSLLGTHDVSRSGLASGGSGAPSAAASSPKKPELIATGPNQVWSWDITRLLGPKKWSYFYLYVIMDIYSRYVVGWMVADRENSTLASRLIQQSCLKHGVQPEVLTLHSDRGAPMTSQCTAQLLADLGVTRSLSRPQVSDDNPFSEAQFKTLKYHPSFPGRFGDQGQAKTFCRSFFRWYNAEHRHGGISMLTPEQVHFGNADQVIARRTSVLNTAWTTHPERFVRGVPKPKPLPEAVCINPPNLSLTTQEIAL